MEGFKGGVNNWAPMWEAGERAGATAAPAGAGWAGRGGRCLCWPGRLIAGPNRGAAWHPQLIAAPHLCAPPPGSLAASAAAGGPAAWWRLLAAGGLFYHLYNQVWCWMRESGLEGAGDGCAARSSLLAWLLQHAPGRAAAAAPTRLLAAAPHGLHPAPCAGLLHGTGPGYLPRHILRYAPGWPAAQQKCGCLHSSRGGSTWLLRRRRPERLPAALPAAGSPSAPPVLPSSSSPGPCSGQHDEAGGGGGLLCAVLPQPGVL